VDWKRRRTGQVNWGASPPLHHVLIISRGIFGCPIKNEGRIQQEGIKRTKEALTLDGRWRLQEEGHLEEVARGGGSLNRCGQGSRGGSRFRKRKVSGSLSKQ